MRRGGGRATRWRKSLLHLIDIPQTRIGVDLCDNKHHYCVFDQGGKLLTRVILEAGEESWELSVFSVPPLFDGDVVKFFRTL